jgi:hypothetical protein
MSRTTPIARLPFETLAEIFECTIALDQTEYSSYDLRRLVSVCRRWRAVMIAYPRLWSSLVFTSVEVTASMLRRSKESPLVVKADFINSPDSKAHMYRAVFLALSNIQRIRVLHINGSKGVREGLLGTVLDRPAPLLESLRLTSYERTTSSMTIPPSLFAGVTPRLRHFAVFHLSVSWCLPLLRNITHLEIRSSPAPSFVAFHNVLSRCPDLKTLILKHALPADSEQFQSPVSLPLLSHLELAGALAGCRDVIQSLSFPQTAAIALQLNIAPDPELLHLLTDLREKISPIACLRLRVGSFSIRAQAWTTAEPLAMEDPSLDLFFDGTYNHHFLYAICEGLALAHLVSLEVGESTLTPVPWEAILDTAQNLRVLTVRSEKVYWLLHLLTPLPGRGVPSPRLRELVLRGVRIHVTDIHNLQTCLLLRRDANVGIEKLKLFEWVGLSKFYVDRLRERLGDVVEWDGIA